MSAYVSKSYIHSWWHIFPKNTSSGTKRLESSGNLLNGHRNYSKTTKKLCLLDICTNTTANDWYIHGIQQKHGRINGESDTDFYKHLGNIQNALGHNPIKPTQLYDGLYTENIYEKNNRELKALKSRNITAGGTLQAIFTVIHMYPMTYASTSNAELGKDKMK